MIKLTAVTPDSFTFVNNWETVFSLDYCVGSSDIHDAIESIATYEYATTGHDLEYKQCA